MTFQRDLVRDSTVRHARSLLQGTAHFRGQSTGTSLAWGLLIAGYASTIVSANWASTFLPAITFGLLIIPIGTLAAGLTLTLRDLLHEALGLPGVTAAVVVGSGMSWLLASPQIAVASVVAFAVSESLDSAVYAALRAGSRLCAVLGSNLAGLAVDSLVFVPLAFGSLAAVPGQLVGKAVATALVFAAPWSVWRRRCCAVPR